MNALARQLRYCRKDLHVWNGRKAVFGVRYLEIPVNDIDRAIDFYEFVFGIKLERDLVDGYPMAHFPPLGDGRGADVTLAK